MMPTVIDKENYKEVEDGIPIKMGTLSSLFTLKRYLEARGFVGIADYEPKGI